MHKDILPNHDNPQELSLWEDFSELCLKHVGFKPVLPSDPSALALFEEWAQRRDLIKWLEGHDSACVMCGNANGAYCHPANEYRLLLAQNYPVGS